MILQSKYLGINLNSPLIVSSSGLSNSLEKIKKMEEYGAGAIVLKSLFEEQILFETSDLLKHNDYPEAEDYIRNYTQNNTLKLYLEHLKKAKEAVNIPIIASINCVSDKNWLDFTKSIEDAGADAIELNIHIFPTEIDWDSKDIEKKYLEIVYHIKQKIKIPVAVKISNQFTNLLAMADKLKGAGASSLVLFNRFYQPDIDIEKMKFTRGRVFSDSMSYTKELRWIGLLSGRIPELELSASTGVHSSAAALQLILAGADTVQLCSILYERGLEFISAMNSEIESWMKKKNYKEIKSFKGKMSYKNIKNPAMYERAQFMKYFSDLV